MANIVYISAGLPVTKNSGTEDPSAGVNTAYVAAGLPPEDIGGAPPATSYWIWARQKQSQIIGSGLGV